MQTSSQIITTNTPTSNLLQTRSPSCCQNNSFKALKGKGTDLLTTSSPGPGDIPTLSLATKGSGFQCPLFLTSDCSKISKRRFLDPLTKQMF